MKNYDKVIFLGAGFSKSLCWDMPVINDLLNEIDETNELGKMIKNAKEELSEDYTVEKIVSYILSKEIFESEEESYKYSLYRHELLKYIYKRMKDLIPFIDSDEKVKLFRNFFRYCHNEDVLLVTFNYDLFVEEALKACQKNITTIDVGFPYNFSYGINLQRCPYSAGSINGGYYGGCNIELLKLHGSFNWYNLKDTERADIEDIYLVDNEQRDKIYSYKVPFFVPMSNTKYKYFEGNFYKLIWQKLNFHLQNCKEISFIGYGFPETDFDNLMFFNKAGIKEKIKDIVIYKNPADNKNADRLKNIFDDITVHQMDAIEYIKELSKDSKILK